MSSCVLNQSQMTTVATCGVWTTLWLFNNKCREVKADALVSLGIEFPMLSSSPFRDREEIQLLEKAGSTLCVLSAEPVSVAGDIIERGTTVFPQQGEK